MEQYQKTKCKIKKVIQHLNFLSAGLDNPSTSLRACPELVEGTGFDFLFLIFTFILVFVSNFGFFK